MKTIRNYGWALKILGAALLIGLAIFLEFDQGEAIVTAFIGAAIIIYSGVRLVPFVKTQGSDLIKTINIIEITLDVVIGALFILVPVILGGDLKIWFGYLLGLYLMMRGAVHFYSVSEGNEKSDLTLYIFHIAALIIGSYVFFKSGGFEAAILVHLILLFSVLSGGYLSYDGYKGYKAYRYQKTLQLPKEKVVHETVEKELPIIPEEQEHEQDQIVS